MSAGGAHTHPFGRAALGRRAAHAAMLVRAVPFHDLDGAAGEHKFGVVDLPVQAAQAEPAHAFGGRAVLGDFRGKAMAAVQAAQILGAQRIDAQVRERGGLRQVDVGGRGDNQQASVGKGKPGGGLVDLGGGFDQGHERGF
ncbi:MAG: hypothetical protein WDN04_17855 [Rhodospirillales bacterium]